MTGNGPPPAVEPPAIDIVRLDAPDDQGAIPLETGPAPDHLSTGFPPVENWFSFGGRTMVRNVSGATLTPFLPDGDEASGAAVVIAAGGGYLIESMETEAWAQARWLAARGVAAFVLKYRLQPTPVDDSEFRTALIARFAQRMPEHLHPAPEPDQVRLKALSTRRRQITEPPRRPMPPR